MGADWMEGGPRDGPVENAIHTVEYATSRGRIEFVDPPSTAECIQQLSLGNTDGVIVVVSALVGCSQETQGVLALAGIAGVRDAVVWVSHFDQCSDPALLELVHDEALNLLGVSGFPEDTPIVFGAAGRALRNNAQATSKIGELIAALDCRFSVR